jgi:hypothetical protein
MSRLQQDCEGAPFNNMFVDMWTACSLGKARPISTSRLTRLRTVVAGWLRGDLTAAGLGIDVVEARRCTPPDSGNGRSTASCVFPADDAYIWTSFTTTEPTLRFILSGRLFSGSESPRPSFSGRRTISFSLAREEKLICRICPKPRCTGLKPGTSPSKIVSTTFPKTCIASTAIGLHPKPGGPDVHVILAMANDPILQSTPQGNTSPSVELGALKDNQGDQEYALPGKYRRDAIHCRCNPL